MIETIISTAISIIASIVLTIIGIKYSSQFHVRKKGIAKERYTVMEKISHGTKNGFIDSSRVILTKSSSVNALGFMDISLTTDIEDIIVDRYAFTNTFIHNIFAPGKIILNRKKTWTEHTPSNQFDEYQIRSTKLDQIPLSDIHKKIKNKITECRAVESTFSYPNTYTGPRYKKRLIILAKNIGIIYSKTEYVNGNVDIYRLIKYKTNQNNELWLPISNLGNFWEYEIQYEFGPNKLNICE